MCSDPETPPERRDVTLALGQACGGDRPSEGALSRLVYDDLRRVAAGLLRRERADHTLQPTALVHEAWMRLVDESSFGREDGVAAKRMFMSYAVQAMRHILIEHARARVAEKRGGALHRVPFAESVAHVARDAAELVDLDSAVTSLSDRMPQTAKVAELRLYGGMSNADVAEILQIPERTAKNEWALAQALLSQQLRDPILRDPS